MRLRDGLRDCEPKTGTVALRVLSAIETLKEPCLCALRETRTGVAHPNHDGSIVATAADVNSRPSG